MSTHATASKKMKKTAPVLLNVDVSCFLLARRGWTCVDKQAEVKTVIHCFFSCVFQCSRDTVCQQTSAKLIKRGETWTGMRTVSDKMCVFVFYWHEHVLPVKSSWFIQDIWMGHTMHPCQHAPWTHPEASCLYLEKMQFIPGGNFLGLLWPGSEVCSQRSSRRDQKLSEHRANWNEKKKSAALTLNSIPVSHFTWLQRLNAARLLDRVTVSGRVTVMGHRSFGYRPNSALPIEYDRAVCMMSGVYTLLMHIHTKTHTTGLCLKNIFLQPFTDINK